MGYNINTLRQRIIRCVKVDENGCWIWQRYLDKYGYGNASVYLEKRKLAHQWSYIVFKGEIPPGKSVCHRCDIRSCVNPDHLFLGTPGENARDMWKKGRGYDNRGEKHPSSKLKQVDIDEIFRLKESGLSQGKIATMFKVNQTTISNILNEKVTRWRRSSAL